MMSQDEIEAAAKALYEKDLQPFEMPWAILTEQHKDRYRAQVRPKLFLLADKD